MNKQISLRWVFFGIGLALSLSCAMIFFRTPEVVAAFVPSLIRKEKSVPKLPTHIRIPTIGVDATFEYLGLTPSGSMAVPKGPDHVAWFNQGPLPGAKGSAVIAGHFGWKNGISAVFDHISQLKKGDMIYIQDEKATIRAFVVTRTKIYDQNASARDVFYSNDGIEHLNLVTCEGIWNKTEKSYSGRLVVFADMLQFQE